MPTCEMCGKDFPSLRRAIVEGTLMSVCGSCVRFGVEQAGQATEVTGRSRVTESLERRAQRSRPRDIYDQMQEELIPEYADEIRKGRQRKGLTVEDLAKRISEKQATLQKVEGGTLHPSDTLVKKLEKELDIKLMEKPEYAGGAAVRPSGQAGNKALTLGDLLKEAMKGDKKGG